MVSAITVTVLMLGTTAMSYSNLASTQQPKTANAQVPITSILEKQKEEYTKWIKGINNDTYLDPNGDQDGDKLTNFEEFLVGSHPLTTHTCNINISDSENLINLINPATCKGIDTNNPAEVAKFGQVVNLPALQKTLEKKK